jgi:hypothetical protein
MAQPIRYLVIHRDTAHGPPRYFGPFVSVQVAEQFCDDLPATQLGGRKHVRMLEPFGVHDMSLIETVIKGERQPLVV